MSETISETPDHGPRRADRDELNDQHEGAWQRNGPGKLRAIRGGQQRSARVPRDPGVAQGPDLSRKADPQLMTPRSSPYSGYGRRVLRDQLRDNRPCVSDTPWTPSDVASTPTCAFLPVLPRRRLATGQRGQPNQTVTESGAPRGGGRRDRLSGSTSDPASAKDAQAMTCRPAEPRTAHERLGLGERYGRCEASPPSPPNR